MRLLFIILLSSSISFGQVSAPSYEQVISYVDDYMSVQPERGWYEIAFKPSGYYLMAYGQSEDRETIELGGWCVWNAQTAKWQRPDVPLSEEFEHIADIYETKSYFDRLWSRRNLNKSLLYYGYPDWMEDTRKTLENKANKTSEDREHLARTYSAEASNLIHPGQYGNTGNSKEFEYEPASYEELPQERVDRFTALMDKSLEMWEEIRKIDPSYEPKVITDLDMKIAHEYMHVHLMLEAIKRPDLAVKYLNKAKYSEAVLTYAKTALNQCEKDGFLLTNGDSDTYPLWFAQRKLGYRPDVVVINMSLAQVEWYARLTMDQYKLKSSISTNQWKELQSYYFVHMKPEAMSFGDWFEGFMESFRAGETEKQVDINGFWEIPNDDDVWHMKDRSYSTFIHLFLADMMDQNLERKWYAMSPWSFKKMGLIKYYIMYGSISKILNQQPESPFNDESESSTMSYLEALPNDYISGLKNWGESLAAYELFRLESFSEEKGAKVLQLIDEKVLSNYKDNDYPASVARSIGECYAKFDSTSLSSFFTDYSSSAKRIIQGIESDEENLYDEIDQLEDIISLYTQHPSYMFGKYFDPVIWHGPKSVQSELETKIAGLISFCEKENLKWSHKKLQTLESVLNSCRFSE